MRHRLATGCDDARRGALHEGCKVNASSPRPTPRRLIGMVAYAALTAAAVAAVGLLPMTDYMMHILVQTASYAIAVFGLTVVLGLCGQINLAQAAFFGFGAYAVHGLGTW